MCDLCFWNSCDVSKLLILVRHRENTSMTRSSANQKLCALFTNGIAHACSAQRMLLHLRSADFSRFYTEGMKSPVSASKVLSKIGGLCFCTSKENYVFAGHYCIADGRSRHPLHDLLAYETGRPLSFSITATHVYKIVYGCMHTQIESPYSNLCSAY